MDDPDDKEVTHRGEIWLKTDHAIGILRERFEETVTTHYLIRPERFTRYRFWKSLKERMTVMVGEDAAAHIWIRGEQDLVVPLEANLLEAFTDEVEPPAFNSVLGAISFLDSRLANGWISQLRHACIEKPDQLTIERLTACYRKRPLSERLSRHESFPRIGSEFTLGDQDWGVTIRFRRQPQSECFWWAEFEWSWWIEGIVPNK